jgi:hypothetical protein
LTGKPKRRVRIRRKRRSDGGLIDADDLGDAAETFGCCLFEVVIAAAATMLALVAIPIVMLG